MQLRCVDELLLSHGAEREELQATGGFEEHQTVPALLKHHVVIITETLGEHCLFTFLLLFLQVTFLLHLKLHHGFLLALCKQHWQKALAANFQV